MPRHGSTTARGYGSAHQGLRKRWAERIAQGGIDCWRCGRPISPGGKFDLGHDDHDRSRYRGPEHPACNRATKGRNRPKLRPANIYLVTGPPAAGKTTWVRDNAKPGDITIDYDAIANALTLGDDTHKHTPAVQTITKAARQAAIDTALRTPDVDVYIIHAMPSSAVINRYRDRGAQVVTIDPGQDVVLARCRAERPWQMQQAAKRWYSQQATIVAQKTSGATSVLAWFDRQPDA